MTKTAIRLGGFFPNQAKLFAPIFTNPQHSYPVSLSITAINEHIKNVKITIVYWDGGQQITIKDYLAGGATTPIDFTIKNPTALPPFILYLEADGLPGSVDIEVDYGTQLLVSTLNDNDFKILSEDGTTLPSINSNDISYDKGIVDIISKIKQFFGTAEEVRSPLVIDLDGDGVETVTAEGGVYFDHDANGFKENSGWVGQDDGILVRDINGNGIIDNGTELFGNNSVLSSGEKAVNGFEALKDLDDNNDGIFDRNDKAWNEVKIWQDKNFNGNYSIVKSANPVFA